MTYMGDSATNFNISEAANEDVTSGVTNRESKIFFNGYLENFDIWSIYLKPSGKECVLISFYVVVFAVSLTGNILTMIYILRRKHLQTTVNYFVLNLAVADILVTLICLPPTLIVDFFEIWLLGKILCKFTPYLQMTVACVSSFSLGAIAVNRWYVVCRPLQAIKFGNFKNVSMLAMALIWTFSLTTLCPVTFKMELVQRYNVSIFPELELLKDCEENWSSNLDEAVFHLYYVIACYAFPLVVLSLTYSRVFQVLRRAKIPGQSMRASKIRIRTCSCSRGNSDALTKLPLSCSAQSVTNGSSEKLNAVKESNNSKLDVSHQTHENEPSSQTNSVHNDNKITSSFAKKAGNRSDSLRFSSQHVRCRKCSAQEILLTTRRRCAFMQVALILVFGFCYAPVMVLDVLRKVFRTFDSMDRDAIHFIFALAHLVMYLNSALNPIIYNFFSAQFRKEFKKTFCFFFKSEPRRHNSTVTNMLKLSRVSQRWPNVNHTVNSDSKIHDLESNSTPRLASIS